MNAKVLIVDDTEHVRKMLVDMLELDGFEVVGEAASGHDAVILAGRTDPDVIVMDYRMPGMDGVEATAAVRAECPGARVVCLTASADPLEESALQAAGAVACLRKDQALNEIVGAIRAAAATGTPT